MDLAGLPAGEREAEARRLALEEAQRPFELASGPLLRTTLLRLSDSEHVLVLVMHHIISDGGSMGVLLREMAALYEAFSQGRPSPLPALPLQYGDYSRWQRQWLQGESLQRGLAYWKQQLSGAPPVLELPTDKPRPTVRSQRGASQPVRIPRARWEALKALARTEGTTPFMLLQAAFQVLLYRYSGQEDFCLGTPVAGRPRPELDGLIGFFVNTLVLRARVGGNPSFQRAAAAGAGDDARGLCPPGHALRAPRRGAAPLARLEPLAPLPGDARPPARIPWPPPPFRGCACTRWSWRAMSPGSTSSSPSSRPTRD